MTLLNRLRLKTRLLLLVLAIALPAFAIVAASRAALDQVRAESP